MSASTRSMTVMMIAGMSGKRVLMSQKHKNKEEKERTYVDRIEAAWNVLRL